MELSSTKRAAKREGRGRTKAIRQSRVRDQAEVAPQLPVQRLRGGAACPGRVHATHSHLRRERGIDYDEFGTFPHRCICRRNRVQHRASLSRFRVAPIRYRRCNPETWTMRAIVTYHAKM